MLVNDDTELQPQRCGLVALVGRPNVGKSTLLNQLVGQKLSITSAHRQTTRHSVMGIKTTDGVQVIYVDTPGFHKGNKSALNRMINKNAEQALQGVDSVVFILDALRWTAEDEAVLSRLRNFAGPVYLAINKVDLVKPRIKLLACIEKYKSLLNFSDIIPLSSKTGENLKALGSSIEKTLPVQPFIYPEDQVTNKSLRSLSAEFVREEIIKRAYAEIPYSIFIEVESFTEEKAIALIAITIYVEKESQKSIIIGSKGLNLKKIGTNARYKLQKLIGKKVNLTLWVKVKENWTEDELILRKLDTP